MASTDNAITHKPKIFRDLFAISIKNHTATKNKHNQKPIKTNELEKASNNAKKKTKDTKIETIMGIMSFFDILKEYKPPYTFILER